MLSRSIKVNLSDGREISVPDGTEIRKCMEISGESFQFPIWGAKVNNELKALDEKLKEDCQLQFLDGTVEQGKRIYRKSLCFVLIRAFCELFPGAEIQLLHSLTGGYFCKPLMNRPFTKQDMKALKNRIDQIIQSDEPFERFSLTKEEIIQLFKKTNQDDKVKLFRYLREPRAEVYSCGGTLDCLFEKLVPSTGYLSIYDLKYYPPGFIIRFPRTNNPVTLSHYVEEKKLFRVFYEYKNWATLMGVADVPSLNEVIASGDINDLIRVAEALHEKKIAAIADLIAKHKEHLRLILIAGPSGSGKTTFAHRLSVQLRVNGIKPVAISLDNYFLNRDKTPKDEKGEYNFEVLEALDLELFNMNLHDLLMGEEVTIPRFDFTQGKRLQGGYRLRIPKDQPIIVEGIHCLNEKLTESISRENKFKIYISALTQLNLDNHNRIGTTDTRILRRMVRDRQFRARDALATLKIWNSVRKGEREYIFPFQEEADVMFNSALIYELAVLKNFVEDSLLAIPKSEAEYSEAQRLLGILQFFLKVGTDEIPPNSILREFIGATCFIKADVPL